MYNEQKQNELALQRRILALENSVKQLRNAIEQTNKITSSSIGTLGNSNPNCIVCIAGEDLEQYRIVKITTNVVTANTLSLAYYIKNNDKESTWTSTSTSVDLADVSYSFGVTQAKVTQGSVVPVQICGVTKVVIAKYTSTHDADSRRIRAGVRLGISSVAGTAGNIKYSYYRYGFLEALENANVDDEVVTALILSYKDNFKFRFAKITSVVTATTPDQYKAKEVYYNISTGLWTDVDDGYIWNTDSTSDYYKTNTNLKVTSVNSDGSYAVDDIVTVFADPRDQLQWIIGSAIGGGGMTPVMITSGSGADHVGNVYGNGTDTTATETGVVIKVLQIASGAVIPANTYLFATKIKWSGTKQWTVDVARAY